MVIIGVNYGKPERFCIAGAFVLSYLIFFERIDIGIAIIYDRFDPEREKMLDDCR
jgi:hypothetical protein